jgi:hypothetical protein
MLDENSNQSNLSDMVIPEIDEIETILRTYRPEPNQSFLKKVKGASWMKPTNALPVRENRYQKPNSKNKRFYRYAVGFLSILLLIVLLSATSVGSSLAQAVTRFFQISESGQKTETISLTPFPTSDPEEYPYNQYPLDISEAENQAGFPVKIPANLPNGWVFRGAKFDSENQEVGLLYSHPTADGDDGFIFIDQLKSEFENDWDLCPQGIVEAATVNGWPAEVATGGVWTTSTRATPGAEREWVCVEFSEISEGANEPMTLRWEEEDIKFEIDVMQTTPDETIWLTQQDLIDLAQSMQ